MKSVVKKLFAGLCTAVLVVGCGIDGSGPDTDSDTAQISGAGIKGPLAFADVKIYALDPSFLDYYDKTSPISITMTNQYAEISGLSIPRKIKPPYILTIDGRNSIDLNTGIAPVIDTLITVVTDDMLASERPIFATPLTTLVYHMARLGDMTRLGNVSIRYKNNSDARKTFIENINNAANLVSSTFVIEQDRDIDLFRFPLVINEYTADFVEQEKAVYHRAAVEAFAAKVYALSLLGDISSDNIIEQLALDIFNDGIIDNSVNGMLIGSIDPVVLSQNPMKLLIPNTPYHIEEIMLLMEEERIFIGTSMGPDFLVDEIAFPEVTSTPASAVTLSGTTSTESSNTGTTVAYEPVVMLSVDSINFGSLYVGATSDPIELVLTNSGSAPLNISDISISSGFIEANNCDNFIPVGGNCILDVQYIPATTGNVTGTLSISSDAATSPDAVSLEGYGVLNDASNTSSSQTPAQVDPNAPEIQFYHDFNDEKLHAYTDTDILTTWKSGTAAGLSANAVKVVPDPDPSGTHGKVMQVFYAANQYGFHGESGSQWRTKINGSHDELYLAYDVFFTVDAEYVLAGKLPGLMGGPVMHTGGFPADGTDGWTGRMVWKSDGKITNYMYHADQPTKYGELFNWDDGNDGQVYLQRGQWNRLEVRYVMNTPGVTDGHLQAWLNGQLVLDRRDVMYRMPGGENVGIDRLLFSTFYGGNAQKWAPPADQYVYFDNFIVSTLPITH